MYYILWRYWAAEPCAGAQHDLAPRAFTALAADAQLRHTCCFWQVGACDTEREADGGVFEATM